MKQGYRHLLLFSMITLFISSCGITRKGAQPQRSDYPEADTAVIEEGIASWYGPNFHGKLTANGETYDMDGMTAAHRSLPFNTVVQVENLDNGKDVVVRINDRGPYAHNRIIDLSRRAARQIDMEDAGTARVQLFLVEEGDRPLSADNLGSIETFTVQLAAFQTRREAENFTAGLDGTRIEPVQLSGKTVYRIYYGIYPDPSEARTELDRLKRRGYDGFVKQTQN